MKVGVARVDSSPDCCVPVFGAAVTSGPRMDSTMGLSVGAAAVGGTAVGGTAVGGAAVGGTAVGASVGFGGSVGEGVLSSVSPPPPPPMGVVVARLVGCGVASAAAWRLPWG